MFWNTYRRGGRCCCTYCPCCCNSCNNGNNSSNGTNNGNTAGTTRYVDIPATRIVVSDAGSSNSGSGCSRCR